MGWKITLPSTIYAIRCSENGKVYIGRTQDLDRRMKEHLKQLKDGRKRRDYGTGYEPSDFQKDFDQYGEEAFETYVLEKNVAPDKVREREAYWIAEYCSSEREYGYNKNTEQPASGFNNFKPGRPPKKCEGESVYHKFDRLTPDNKQVVKVMIQSLLKRQEENV